ncbi:MAG: lactate utilization protein [Pseudomonadota bacterium]
MERKNYQAWLWEKWGTACVANLKKHRFDAHFVETAEDARSLLRNLFDGCRRFGFGGSDTTRSLGLPDMLRADGRIVIDHLEPGLSFEEQVSRRKQQAGCDCFICSANAISMTGEIVNVDGIGNRTNAMSFGPEKVIIVAGMNKVTADLHQAIKRVHDVAAPMRAKSLNMDTPCAKTGICMDCNADSRICNITVILHRKPMLTDISVVLINQALGY